MHLDELINRFEKRIKTASGWQVVCPAHHDKNPSLTIARGKHGGIVLHCFAGCPPESICSALRITLKDLAPPDDKDRQPWRCITRPAQPPPAPPKPEPDKALIETIYSYTDILGRELFQVLRLKPKSFRQRHSDGNGGWIWSMDGVERVLYRLPEVLASKTVVVTEGCKDANNLVSLGFCATTNVGGSSTWLDGYAETLAGKEVILCGDNDEPGRKHMARIFDSIAAKAKSIRVITIPEPHKDVSDFIATFSKPEEAAKALAEMIDAAVPTMGGVRMPIYSLADISPRYARLVRESSKTMLDLSKWLPSLRRMRPIIPGELVLILGDTASGKSCWLQNIAFRANNLPTLMFEMELSEELLFERFMALGFGQTCQEIADNYAKAGGEAGADAINWKFPKLMLCSEPRLTLSAIESIICRADLRMGVKPVLIIIDYVQLMQGRGVRYERTSDIAEGLKTLAKATKTIVVVASQVGRRLPDDKGKEIRLHSGKDSGSLENSAGLVLGIWQDTSDSTLMHLKVLKATKGGAGTTVKCNFDGARMNITERIEPPEWLPHARKV